MKTYLPNVMAAISAMSVPVGPQGSLLVAVEVSISHERLSLWNEHTISNLHLHTRITLGNVLDASHDFRHGGGGGGGEMLYQAARIRRR